MAVGSWLTPSQGRCRNPIPEPRADPGKKIKHERKRMVKPSSKSPDSTKEDLQPQASEKSLFPLPKGSGDWVKLAECEEFCLYRKPDGMTITRRSPAVQLAYWKAKFVISNADNKKRSVEDRARLALALQRLALFKQFSLPRATMMMAGEFLCTASLQKHWAN